MSLFSTESPVLASTTIVGSNKVMPYETVNVALSATSVSQGIFIAPNFSVSGTAGGSGAALTIEHLTGTQAAGAGTALLTATIPLTGTANTVLYGTLSTTVTAAQGTISPGDRIGVILSGTLTGLANCILQVSVVPA